MANVEDGDKEKDLVGSYFLELWSLRSRMAAVLSTKGVEAVNSVDELEEQEPVPKELDTPSEFAIVSSTKLSVYYPKKSVNDHDVGAVQANCPAPVKCFLYYFEIEVEFSGDKGDIAIGFTKDDFPLSSKPGHVDSSFGYYGNGLVYLGKGLPRCHAVYSTGDIVGAGINYSSGQIFFTLNGILEVAVKNYVKGRLYSTVAVHSQHEKVNVNFGKHPFRFNVKVTCDVHCHLNLNCCFCFLFYFYRIVITVAFLF